MKESHVEGVATHDDPGSCTGIREDGSEALTGARAGRVLSREMHLQDADAVILRGRQHRQRRHRETQPSPARSETPCTYGTYLRENREICGSLGAVALRAASGRS
jgi:RNA-directed DNA polymerase